MQVDEERITRNELNALLDVLFDQIEKLEGKASEKADIAICEWQHAKTLNFLGLGPITARHEYIFAYKTLKGLGLEVGGMLPPYQS